MAFNELNTATKNTVCGRCKGTITINSLCRMPQAHLGASERASPLYRRAADQRVHPTHFIVSQAASAPRQACKNPHHDGLSPMSLFSARESVWAHRHVRRWHGYKSNLQRLATLVMTIPSLTSKRRFKNCVQKPNEFCERIRAKGYDGVCGADATLKLRCWALLF